MFSLWLVYHCYKDQNILSDNVTRTISQRRANKNLICRKCRVFFLVCHVL
jgi:hypothetical protein